MNAEPEPSLFVTVIAFAIIYGLFYGAPLLAMALCARSVWHSVAPAYLLTRGRYAEARSAAERLGKSWMRVFPSTPRAARCVVATALHLEGRTEESLAIVEELKREKLDPNLKYAVISLEGANLVLDERAPERARDALREAVALWETPEDLLLLAHAELTLGDAEEAARLVERAGPGTQKTRIALGLRTVLLEDVATKRGVFGYVRGLYHLRTGRPEAAAQDFEAAVATPFHNVYTERARALLARPAAEADARSSFAPQIVERGEGTKS